MNRLDAKKASKIKGFSLIELLLSVAVLGILIAVSLPSFQDTIESQVTVSQIKVMQTALNLARSEAIKRGRNVAICPSNDGVDCDAGDWDEGWVVFVDANDDANGSAGSIDNGDTIIRVFDSLGSSSVLTGTTNLLEFNSFGFNDSGAIVTFKICPESNNADNARSLEVALAGRPRRIEDGLVCP